MTTLIEINQIEKGKLTFVFVDDWEENGRYPDIVFDPVLDQYFKVEEGQRTILTSEKETVTCTSDEISSLFDEYEAKEIITKTGQTILLPNYETYKKIKNPNGLSDLW